MTGAATMSEQFYAKVARLFPYGISNDTVADASLIRELMEAAIGIFRAGDKVAFDKSGRLEQLLTRVRRLEDERLLREDQHRMDLDSLHRSVALRDREIARLESHVSKDRQVPATSEEEDADLTNDVHPADFTTDNLDKVRKFMLAQRTGANAPRAAAMDDVISAFKTDLVENVVRLVGRSYFTMGNLNMVPTFVLDQPAKANSPRSAWMDDVVPAFKSDLKTNVDRVIGLLKSAVFTNLTQYQHIDRLKSVVDKEVNSAGVPEMDALTSDASLLRYKAMSESADCPLCPKCGARVERAVLDEDVRLFLIDEANRLLAGSSEVAAELAGLKLSKIAAELFAEGQSDHVKIERSIKILCDLDDKSKPPGAL